jgi:hypothetical protein
VIPGAAGLAPRKKDSPQYCEKSGLGSAGSHAPPEVSFRSDEKKGGIRRSEAFYGWPTLGAGDPDGQLLARAPLRHGRLPLRIWPSCNLRFKAAMIPTQGKSIA